MEEVARLVQALTPQDRQALVFLDMQVRVREPAEWTSEGAEPTYGVLNCLRYWEILVRRMEDEWVRQDYYLADEYLNVLTSRDRVECFLEVMPAGLRAKTTRCIDRLDARFRDLTFDDRGAELSKHWYPLAEGQEVRWWWTRRPIDLPRDGEGAGSSPYGAHHRPPSTFGRAGPPSSCSDQVSGARDAAPIVPSR